MLCIETQNYNYKVQYVKGKDNACTDFLSYKDEGEKPPVPTIEELATEIFHPQYHATGALYVDLHIQFVFVFTLDGDNPTSRLLMCLEHNVKHLVCIANLKCWYISLFARPPNVLLPPIFLTPCCLGAALATQSMSNFHGHTQIGFDTESILAADMKNFKSKVPMPADPHASSYPCYIQLAFPNGNMLIFTTFTAKPEDWTALFSLIDGDHTIVISYDGADN
uniref:Uncharacterized protein n=1 Tax=Romanomermis culicivorax TaxID=13658 RepID=A0A915J1V3_ROMCU